jgi:1-acyl-sn-glycerol-3-phosphate acyltransferase
MSFQKLVYQPYKYLIFYPMTGIVTAIFASSCVLACVTVGQRFGSKYFAKPWAKILFSITPATMKVDGHQHMNPKQSYVVVANHMSMFDILALYGWLNLDLKWVMKKELRKVPFIGFACAAMGHIFIDRKNKQAAVAALDSIKSSFTNGLSVMFFPEGTRSNNGKLKRFKRGAFVTAQDLELPILPVTVLGTKEILPNGTMDLTPGKARLVIHEPIHLNQVKNLSVEELSALAFQKIDGAL